MDADPKLRPAPALVHFHRPIRAAINGWASRYDKPRWSAMVSRRDDIRPLTQGAELLGKENSHLP
jgi:hypothetical protein